MGTSSTDEKHLAVSGEPRTVKDLIYDVGMHNGNDTAFYLACGFHVIAIEADPDLAASAIGNRFEKEVKSGQLTVLNIGIADHSGPSEFWVNEVRSALNSFDRSLAVRSGERCHSVLIQCKRLDEIVSEYGIPYYMKIDIEGHDLICCNQLSSTSKPKYISVEMSRVELLLKLRDLGYDRFKLIHQVDMQAVEARDLDLRVHLLKLLYRLAHYQRSNRKLSLRLARMAAAKCLGLARAVGLCDVKKPIKSRLLPAWKFPAEDIGTYSGSFAEDLPGEWLDWEEIAYIWHRDSRECKKLEKEFPCDLHATF
jgi:FkbM family methyltransferase